MQELPVFPLLLSKLPAAPPTPRHLHSITLNLITESKFCLARTFKGAKTNASGHKLLYLILPPGLPRGFFLCPCYVVLVSEPPPGQMNLIRNLVINQILWGFKESCKHKRANRKFSLSLWNDYHCFSVKPHLYISSAVTSHAIQVPQGKWEEKTHHKNRSGVREMIADHTNGPV